MNPLNSRSRRWRNILIAVLAIGSALPFATTKSSADVYEEPYYDDYYDYNGDEFDYEDFLRGMGYWAEIGRNRLRVWFPYETPSSWAPFQRGYFYHHDSYGAVWYSLDPWGEVTDHYGHWEYFVNLGWGWIPDPDYVYRPFGGSFVYSDGLVGISAYNPLYETRYQSRYRDGYSDGFNDGFDLGYEAALHDTYWHHWTFIEYQYFFSADLHRKRVRDHRRIRRECKNFYRNGWYGTYLRDSRHRSTRVFFQNRGVTVVDIDLNIERRYVKGKRTRVHVVRPTNRVVLSRDDRRDRDDWRDKVRTRVRDHRERDRRSEQRDNRRTHEPRDHRTDRRPTEQRDHRTERRQPAPRDHRTERRQPAPRDHRTERRQPAPRDHRTERRQPAPRDHRVTRPTSPRQKAPQQHRTQTPRAKVRNHRR